MRFFSSDMLGSGSNYMVNGIVNHGQFEQKNWGNFLEAPASYCGIISMVLMAQVFSFLDKPVRRWYIIFLVIWLIPIFFPFFRYAFWLFNGDYYRVFSLTISLVFIIFSVKALDLIIKKQKINLVVLGATVLALLILESYPYFKDYQKLIGGRAIVDESISIFSKIFIVAYGLILFFISRSKNPNNLKYALIALVGFELIYMSGFTVNRRVAVNASELKEKVSVGYNDYSIDALDYIKKNRQSAIYRIDKKFFSSGASNFSLNDNMVQGFYTTSSYSSFAQLNYINYLKAYNVISKDNEYESRWAPGLINPPNRMIPISILESLNSVKYILAKRSPSFAFNPNWNVTYDSVNKFNDVLVLKSKYALPFGYTYDKYIPESDFNKLSATQKELISTTACILKDEDVSKSGAGLKRLSLADTINIAQFTFPMYKENMDKLKKDTLTVSFFLKTKLKAKQT